MIKEFGLSLKSLFSGFTNLGSTSNKLLSFTKSKYSGVGATPTKQLFFILGKL